MERIGGMLTHSLTKKEFAELSKEALNKRWLDNYKRLIAFKEQYNRWPHEKEMYQKAFNIGAWITRQRDNQNKGILPLWRYKLLAEIGFIWKVQDTWWEIYEKYQKWYTKHKRLPMQSYSVCTL
jgi:hypothetical protein